MPLPFLPMAMAAATTAGPPIGASLAAMGSQLLPSLGQFGLNTLANSSLSFGGDNFSATIGDPRMRMIQQMMSSMGGGMNPSVITRTGQKEDPFSMLGRLIAPRFRFNMGR